ncbi:MAG: hypothetical protein QM710_14185 [Flavobacterium sp.]
MNIDIGIEKRKNILAISLMLEGMTSAFLAQLIGIENHIETISFGNKSSSLSFNQKIGLLIDIGALPPEEKGKFQLFMEIRNQFMHNLQAKTYELCFSFLPGRDKFILKLYPQDGNLNVEEQLEKATMELSDEVSRITVNLIEKVKEKFERDIELDMLKKIFPVLLKTMEKFNKK